MGQRRPACACVLDGTVGAVAEEDAARSKETAVKKTLEISAKRFQEQKAKLYAEEHEKDGRLQELKIAQEQKVRC
jgi:hypothetical protein